MHVRPMSIISRKPMPPGGFCYLEREPLSPGPHQQQCPSNIVERYKLNDSFDNVECCFDIVAVCGNNVECCFDNVACCFVAFVAGVNGALDYFRKRHRSVETVIAILQYFGAFARATLC